MLLLTVLCLSRKNAICVLRQPPNNRAAIACPSCAADIFDRVPVQCPDCDVFFDSTQKLAVYRFKKHAKRRFIRSFIDTVHCPCCLTLFHERERVLNNLSYRSKRCHLFVYSSFMPLDSHVVDSLDRDAADVHGDLRKKGWSSCKALHSAIRFCGPYERTAYDFGLKHKSGLSNF